MLYYGMVNLREWALAQGIHPQTAYRWYREGKLRVPARKIGKLILVGNLATSPTGPDVRSRWPAGRR
jgi:putative resolvase